MIEPTALSLSKLLSELTDRHVSFTLAPNSTPKSVPMLFAVYAELPDEAPLVAHIDRSAVAVLGGALLGLPEYTAIQRSVQLPKDEPVWDAMNEILNIFSSGLSTQGRVVLKSVATEAPMMPSAAQGILSTPKAISTYQLAINSKQHGLLTLYS